jgi:hypothetical protein
MTLKGSILLFVAVMMMGTTISEFVAPAFYKVGSRTAAA